MRVSTIVFTVLVVLAALIWLLAMVGLAGGWKRLSPYLPKDVSIGSVSGVALIVIFGLLVAVYRHEGRRHPVRARMVAPEAAQRADQALQAANAPSSLSKQAASIKKTQDVRTAPLKPGVAENIPSLVADQGEKKPSVAPFRGERIPPSPLAEVALNTPAPAKFGERVSREAVSRPMSNVIDSRRRDVPEAIRQTAASPESPSRRPIILTHGTKALSEPQSRQVCGAVSLYAGTEIYIKWSPGASSGQLANQLSKVMDCARVVVTFASEQPGMEGHGVRVGTHADEGETTDRISPFADAIAAALREQGFNVAEVSGSNIPANQTAIFIGSD